MEKQGPRPVQLRAVMDDSVAQGIYVNFAAVQHNASEFFLDFGRIVPGKQEVKVLVRLVATPRHLKEFLRVFKGNLEQFEKQHGEIPTAGEKDRKVGFTGS